MEWNILFFLSLDFSVFFRNSKEVIVLFSINIDEKLYIVHNKRSTKFYSINDISF